MTAYSVTPVDSVDREHGVVVEIPSRAELMQLLAETIAARDAAHAMWMDAVNARAVDRARLQRASRVLASLARLSPRMADVVAAAGREIYQLDRQDRLRRVRAERRAREIWGLDE